MRNDKLLKNKAVIKALSIGLAAMMAITPVVGTVDVYAGDGDPGNDDPSEIKSEAKVELKGTSTTSVDGEQSDSHEVSGSADVSLDVSGNISVEAEVEHNDVDIDNTQQADASIVPNADGTVTETDTAVSTGTEETEIGNKTTKTDTRVETKVETTTASDINDYENLSTTQTEGSVEVKTIVTSVTVTITTTETTVSTTYDEKVTDADTIAAIEAAIADPAEGQIRTDETGNYITVNGQEYKYTQTPITTQAPVEDAAVLEKINEELLKEDKNVTKKDGKNYVEVEGIWYEYEVETVDQTSAEGKETMSNLKAAAEGKTGTTVTNDNVTTETMVLTVGDKAYTYKVTHETLTVLDEKLLETIKSDVEHERSNVKVEDGKTPVTIGEVTYTYTSKAGSDIVTVDASTDKELFDKIVAAADDVAETNADGSKTVTVGGVEYKYFDESSEDIILDASKAEDKATIDSIKAAIEEARQSGEPIATKTIDDVEYELIVIDGVTYGFNSTTTEPTKNGVTPVTDESIMNEIRAAYNDRDNSSDVTKNDDGTYTIKVGSDSYIYTPGEDYAVSSTVAKLIELSKYNAISTNDMWVNGHINGGVIVCQSLHGYQFIDSNLSSGSVMNPEDEPYVESKVNKTAGNCNVSIRVINDNNGNGGQVAVKDHVSPNNDDSSTYASALTDLSDNDAKTIASQMEKLWDSAMSKFTEGIKEYVENGITFKLVDKDYDSFDIQWNGEKHLTDNLDGLDHSMDDIHGGGRIADTVYVVAKDIANLCVGRLKSIILAPFTNISTFAGDSVGTIIGHNVTIDGSTELHSGKIDPSLGNVPDSAVKEEFTTETIEKAFKTVVESAKALFTDSTPSATYEEVSYDATYVSAKKDIEDIITKAWERKDTVSEKVTVEQLSGQTITHWFGTKSTPTPPPTPPVVPPTPPVVPPTPPVVPPTPPVTPPGTPDVPVTPGTPEVPGVPTTPTGVLGVRRGESKPAAAVLGARRGVLGEKRVLGARTEDTSNAAAAFGVILGSVALSGAWLTLRRKKKVQ